MSRPTGAVLGGRKGWDHFPDASNTYGGAWDRPRSSCSPTTPRTRRPPTESRSSIVAQRGGANRVGGRTGGKNLEVFSPTIGRQLLELGLIDEIDLHIAPILLSGIRLYNNPGREPIRLHRVGEGDPTSAVNVRYRPATKASPALECR